MTSPTRSEAEWTTSYPLRRVVSRHACTTIAETDEPARMLIVECGHYIAIPDSYDERDGMVPCGECHAKEALQRA